MLRVITLGGLRLERDGVAVSDKMRPRRLALLAILAAAGPNGLTREAVLAILWSESSPERARHSLAQEVYALRSELDAAIIPPGPTLRLAPEHIMSDVADLRAAINDGNSAAIDALDAGPFLDGFYLSDAPDFERWVDDERSNIRRDVIAALERSALERERDNEPDNTAIWERLVRLDPLCGRFAAGLMRARAQSGDRAGALAVGQSHILFVERELGVDADDVVLRLIEELRAQVASPGRHPEKRNDEGPLRADVRQARVGRYWKPVAMAASLLIAAAIVGSLFWRRADAAATARSQAAAPVVLRLHEAGRRAFYQGDYAAAARLFNAALAEDSSFIPAAYFAWRTAVARDAPDAESLAVRALERSRHASERDAQIIRAHVGLSRYDVTAVALADSLSRRFPDDPEVLMRAAEATGDLPAAVALLERAVRADSAQATSAADACRACEALRMLTVRYAWVDSSTAALHTLGRWSDMRPAEYLPWSTRFDYLMKLGRIVEGGDARRRADSLGAPHGPPNSADVERAIRVGAFNVSDSLCQMPPSASQDSIATLIRFRRSCATGLRAQGRLREALSMIRESKAPWTTERGDALPPDLELGAALDMDMGRPLLAAAWHAKVAADSPESSTALSGKWSHRVVWHLTLAATALVQAGDTVRARALVDSVELIGHRSADPRDALLHHFLRGLVLSMSAEHERAIREYRLASTMPAHDFTRIGYEMARSLIAARRPLDAIPALRALLHTDFDEAALTLTSTDIHLSLAEAFAAAGQSDSASVHYATVERAWRRADPIFAPRYQSARAALVPDPRPSR
ncbi:MAG TPA: BTAD domain-containing putative transcriptional regulator [Gemmatimonadaceae bacterium]|jgi:DNA-binding SARP family transcriptional activator